MLFFLLRRRPTNSTRTYTLFPHTTLFRSRLAAGEQGADRFHGGVIVRRAVERDHDRRIADVEVHIGSGDDFTITQYTARGGDGYHLESERLGEIGRAHV